MVCSQAEHGVLLGIGQLWVPICPTWDIQLNYLTVHCTVWLSPPGNGLSLYDISIQGIWMLTYAAGFNYWVFQTLYPQLFRVQCAYMVYAAAGSYSMRLGCVI